MSKNLILRKADSSNMAKDALQRVELRPNGVVRHDDVRAYSLPLNTSIDNFELIPATAVAAGSSKLVLLSGTGTEIIARANNGGVNIKTQSSTPAINDNVMLAGVSTTGFVGYISAKSKLIFRARVNITTITSVLASIGLNENLTDPDPTATAGEGAMFLFDPGKVVTTGLASGAENNWILAHKVNGADTFADTGVKVYAATDYELHIEIGDDLKAKFYIDGVYVGQGPALTSGDSFSVYAGLTTKAAAQRDMDVRYLLLGRNVG